MTARILALEPWDDGSHRAVRKSIERHGDLDWQWLTLPGRGARWRLRHAGLNFAERASEMDSAGERFDAVFVSGLCSMSDFRAAAPKSMRNLPHVLYMHENQAAYPVSQAVDRRTIDRDAHLSFTNLSSIESADRVLWNSRYNRDSFIDQMTILLRRAPESVSSSWIDRLQAKSTIAWPPVESSRAEHAILHNPAVDDYPDDADGRSVVRVAWPHRWEHDKGCDELLALIEDHRDDPNLALRWTILGERYERMPAAMHAILDRHQDVIDHAGHLDSRDDYLQALARCDWVNSTARHEFFGIAVAEAMLLGCLPWLPDRLSYPEIIPANLRGTNPWNPPADPQEARLEMTRHLGPAIAGTAVSRIEQEIVAAID